ncbi:MAG: hypothetical protein JWR90_1551 [Marmoricola sp.]|nr:hypothetical protein [Marmoricola sp.]
MTAGEPIPARPVVVDVVAVVGLMGIALLGLDDSYSTRFYLVVGMVAVGLTSLWALLCLGQRWGTAGYLLVASLAYPIAGATLAYRSLPSLPTVTDTLTATITGPSEFLTTIPPVDATGTVLVIPYLVGFLLGGAAAWMALHTGRPLLPVLPLVAAMVTCVALGTETSTALLVRAAVFTGGVLLWVVLRSARAGELDTGRGGLLRVSGAAVVTLLAVALAASLLPTVRSDARVVLRGRVGSGQEVSQLDNPLSSFRRNTRQPVNGADNVVDRRLLRVRGLPRGRLLRFVALDVYDGTTWSAGNRTVANDSGSLFQRIGRQVGARRPGTKVEVSIEVQRPWTSSWLPLAGQLTGITFDYLDGRAQREDVRYNVATETGMVVGGLGAKDDYHFTAVLPDDRLTRRSTPYGSGVALQPTGGFLDADLAPWNRSGLAPMAQVFSLAKYLRTNGRYSDGGTVAERGFLPGHGQARLGRGFFGARAIVGDDEQYAAFMALAANRLGVPARVVVGSDTGPSGWVRGRNVEAWVELRVADGSWRTLPQDAFMSHRPPKRSDVRQPVQSFVNQDTPKDPPPQQAPTPQQDPRTVEQQHQEPSSSTSPLVWELPLALLVVGLVPGLKWWRRRRRRSAERPGRRVVGGWTEILDLRRDQGHEVGEGLPRVEQARRLGLDVAVARRADDLVFAREEPTAAQAREFWGQVDAQRARAAAELGWPRRLRSWWSLRSLRRSLSRAWPRPRPAAAPGRRRSAGLPGPAA